MADLCRFGWFLGNVFKNQTTVGAIQKVNYSQHSVIGHVR